MNELPTSPAGIDEIWHQHRRRVLDVAYRMLGSVHDAEDVVQEAYSRLLAVDIESIDDVRGWLVTVTSRLCIDRLRAHERVKRAYVGPWLPEPIVDAASADVDLADRITLDDTVRMALMVVLEQLSPAERAAFVLHDLPASTSTPSPDSSAGRPKHAANWRAVPGAASRPTRRSLGSTSTAPSTTSSSHASWTRANGATSTACWRSSTRASSATSIPVE